MPTRPHPPAESRASRGVQSVEVTGKLLDVLAQRGSVSLAALAAAAGIAPAQVHTYLVSLARLGLVKRDAALGDYEPGPLSLRLALRSLEHQPAYRAAVAEVASLAERSGCCIAICTAGPHGPAIVHYENAGTPLHVNLHVGSVMSLTATSTGRVFSAFLGKEARRAMQPGKEGKQEDGETFERGLERIRSRGIERGIDAPTPSISSMSVPIFDTAGALQLTLTAIGPSSTIDVEWNGQVAEALRASARRIEDALRNPPPDERIDRTGVWNIEPGSEDTGQRGIRTLDTTGELLAALVRASHPLILRDLAAAAAMPAAKAFPHLVSLLGIGLLARDEAGAFNTGPLGLQLGLTALQRQAPERDAEHEIARLASETGLTVAAAVLGPLGPTVIRLEESAQPVHISLRAGTVVSLLNTAIGRVFAAYLGDEPLADMLALEPLRLAGSSTNEIGIATGKGNDGKEKKPEKSIGNPNESMFARIRREGIDRALGAPIPGIDALAAPVFDHTNTVRLVLALIGTTGTLDSADTALPAAQALLRATRQLSWRLGWAP
ncbi:IclR family transcriptional regulator [Trinickia dinghuensis]|uniref:IclR family transcriptional regulator n=1 Tax=Trinickia dinghuensis TaxID=2291023 RepID=A0A3D8JW79_9BURK|nr:IclR family transcriptional regulator C-terminal domain-containing protein [Trinickia dinghuensis]RDU97317.1 IclR family transcriptional regulator [Trinickia dinghuensis]